MPENKQSTRVVPVIDLHLKNGESVGNPFRNFDKRKGAWKPLTTKDAWLSHPNPHVLPVNGDYDGEKVVSAERYLEDGGELPDIPHALADEYGPNADDNEFDCPVCGHHMTGQPDECEDADCDAVFKW